jgi:hypothetical protein
MKFSSSDFCLWSLASGIGNPSSSSTSGIFSLAGRRTTLEGYFLDTELFPGVLLLFAKKIGAAQ